MVESKDTLTTHLQKRLSREERQMCMLMLRDVSGSLLIGRRKDNDATPFKVIRSVWLGLNCCCNVAEIDTDENDV